MDFHSPQQSLNAAYWVGNTYVSIKRQDANVFAFLTRLHKGVRMGTGWVLLADTLAGSLVFLSLTGLWLWIQLHGSRLTMAGLGMISLGLAVEHGRIGTRTIHATADIVWLQERRRWKSLQSIIAVTAKREINDKVAKNGRAPVECNVNLRVSKTNT